MYFVSGGIYHVFNQGNNKQIVFFNRNNYLYFLRKLRVQILPFADILSWCLMPNHFHLMIYVIETEVPWNYLHKNHDSMSKGDFSPGATESRARTIDEISTTESRARTFRSKDSSLEGIKIMSLNSSIGILLSSYTRGINIQERRTGSLFRKETHAICLNDTSQSLPVWYKKEGITFMNVEIPEWQYPQSCMDYIHFNPVKSKLAKNPEDWEFSSYSDLAGLRNGTLVNKERIFELKLKV